MASLHILKPELDPTQHMVSEYAIGQYGWLMSLLFFLLAATYFSLFVKLRGELTTKLGAVGRVVIILAASGLVIGGIFTTDPSTDSASSEASLSGVLHGIGAIFPILGTPIASVFITRDLTRKKPWRRYRSLL